MRALNPVLIFPLLLSAPAQGSATASLADPASVACSVAAAYVVTVIAEAKNRPVVFTRHDKPSTSAITGGRWWKTDGTRLVRPPAALIRRFEDQVNRNAVGRCPSVRRLLDSRRVGYGQKAVDAVYSPDPSILFKARVYTISVPVVSADGKKAILYSSGVSGLMATGAYLELLERQPNGKWTVVANSALTVS